MNEMLIFEQDSHGYCLCEVRSERRHAEGISHLTRQSMIISSMRRATSATPDATLGASVLATLRCGRTRRRVEQVELVHFPKEFPERLTQLTPS